MPLRLRRGTDAERRSITPAEGELVYTTDTKLVFVGDGVTLGGNVITASTGGSFTSLQHDLSLNGYGIVGSGSISIDGSIIANDFKGSVLSHNSIILVDNTDSSLHTSALAIKGNSITGTNAAFQSGLGNTINTLQIGSLNAYTQL